MGKVADHHTTTTADQHNTRGNSQKVDDYNAHQETNQLPTD